MRFLKWLFAYGEKYRKQSINYQKGEVAGKIISFLLVAIFAAATIGVELWCFNLFKTSIGLGILSFLFFISFLKVTVDNAILTGLCAFRCAIWGAVEDVVNKQIAKSEQQNVIDITDKNSENAKTKEIKIKKSHKWLDVLIGILSFVIAVGLVVATIYIFLHTISK